jgi:predicted nucleotidyltransferase component of viral defense system
VKVYLVDLIRNTPTQLQARNIVREYLQARILGMLQRSGAMTTIAFHGGTALRFLFSTGRYSEDLDFALEQSSDRYDFRAYLQAIQRDFEKESYRVEIKVSDRRTVHSAFVRFPGLLYDLRLSPHRDEVLAVKIEVDTNPPAGAGFDTTVIRRYVPLQLYHHDKSSLLAGKLHAVLQRPYAKGRDLYDLLWYLSDPQWPEPNLTLLNHALQQTGWLGSPLTEQSWRGAVRQRIETIDWERALPDVLPFLEPGTDANLLTKENLLKVLEMKLE